MHVKFILPALVEARGKYWRPIKYSLFPPLGLATLAGFLSDSDEAEIVDEHVEKLSLDDAPDLVAIEVYVTSARRAYKIADSYRSRGIHVVMGGLHVTACPDEASKHADTIIVGPAEEAWLRFLSDFRHGIAQGLYRSDKRELESLPQIRRDLIKYRNYLVPNSIVVSRGCPHKCDFCYTNSFFRDGKRFYTYSVDKALSEIESLPGSHLFFLDDNIFGDPVFSKGLFTGMTGMRRVWQGAATIKSILKEGLLDLAVKSGLRSLFVGFESLNQQAMAGHNKHHNQVSEYTLAAKLLHERGVMINGSFVYGLDGDDPSVFDTTTEWAIANGIETATFHILTPYPGTDLFNRYNAAGRIKTFDWDLYDTRHMVFSHPTMSQIEIEQGYWRSYKNFYKWGSIFKAGNTKPTFSAKARHIVYSGAWKKFDPLWAMIIKMKQLNHIIPPLETILKGEKACLVNSMKQSQANSLQTSAVDCKK